MIFSPVVRSCSREKAVLRQLSKNIIFGSGQADDLGWAIKLVKGISYPRTLRAKFDRPNPICSGNAQQTLPEFIFDPGGIASIAMRP